MVALAACVTPKQAQPDRALNDTVTHWPQCISEAMERFVDACPQAPTAQPERPKRPCVANKQQGARDDTQIQGQKLRLQPNPALRKAAQAQGANAAIDRQFDRAWNEPRQRTASIAWLKRRATWQRGKSVERHYSHYLLAWLYHRQDQGPLALTAMAAALHSTLRHAPKSSAWIEAGLVELFVQHGQSDQALDDLKTIWKAKDKTERNPKLAAKTTSRLATKLAKRYRSLHRFGDAANVWRSLRAHEPGHACHHQDQVIEALRRKGSVEALAIEIMRLLELSLQPGPHRSHAKHCVRLASHQLVSQADHWLKQGKAQPKAHREKLRLASKLYAQALSTYSDDELTRNGICQTRRTLKQKRAESLGLHGDYNSCAAAYGALIPLETAAGQRKAAFQALQCRQRAWQSRPQQGTPKGRLERMAKSLEHSRRYKELLAEQKRYLCIATSEQKMARYAKTALSRAQTFFAGGLLWESAIAFRQTALQSEHQESALLAAKAYGHVMQNLAADDVCRIEVADDLEGMRRRLCNSEQVRPQCQQIEDSANSLRAITGPML